MLEVGEEDVVRKDVFKNSVPHWHALDAYVFGTSANKNRDISSSENSKVGQRINPYTLWLSPESFVASSPHMLEMEKSGAVNLQAIAIFVLVQIAFFDKTSAFQACTSLYSFTRDFSSVRVETYLCSDEQNSGVSSIDRRGCISSIFSSAFVTAVVTASPMISDAAETETNQQLSSSGTTILRGVVTLKPGAELTSSASAALYVTAKPETTINAPKAIADMFAGRPPPVLTARYSISTGSDAFPFNFQFTESDVTAEGSYEDPNDKKTTNKYWWTNDNLVISARFDSDGVAATRDPDDLVGRTFSLIEGNKDDDRLYRYDKDVEIKLQGRGIGGKFITTKGK